MSNGEANSTWVASTAYGGGLRARQINTLWNDPYATFVGYPNHSIDGNTNGNYAVGISCSHTAAPAVTPWWPWIVYDLGTTAPANSKLVSVQLWNRQDCCDCECLGPTNTDTWAANGIGGLALSIAYHK